MKAVKLIFGMASFAITLWTFLVPDAQTAFAEPTLARILFWHLPCAIGTSLFVFAGGIFGVIYLKTRDPRWDVRSVAAQEMGLLLAIITMLTGILFSKVQWGNWWDWDPRQTSFLMVLVIYMAYFVVRSGYADSNKRAGFSAAYAASALLPNSFLIFIFPRLPQVGLSLHPNDTVTGGRLKGQYGYAVMGTMAMIFTLAIWLYKMRVRAGLLEIALEDFDGHNEVNRGDSAVVGVVRPVSVPDES